MAEGGKDTDGRSWFGEIIAYLLPGYVFLFAGTYVSRKIAAVWEAIILGDKITGAVVLGGIASLSAGLALSGVRNLFEELAKRNWAKYKLDYSKLGDHNTQAFQLAVEQKYRHFQFHGNMALALFALCVARATQHGLCNWTSLLLVLGALVLAASSAVQFDDTLNTLRSIMEKPRT